MGVSFNGHAGAIDWIQSRFKKHKPATLYFDEIRTPSYTDCLNPLFERVLASELAGLFHAGGPQRLSLYKIAQIVNRVGGYDPDLLQGCPRIEAGPIPPRAGDVSLDSSKLIAIAGLSVLDPWPHEPNWTPSDPLWHYRRDGLPGSPKLLSEILLSQSRPVGTLVAWRCSGAEHLYRHQLGRGHASIEKAAVLADQLVVGEDLSPFAEIADHVPMQPGFVFARRFRDRRPPAPRETCRQSFRRTACSWNRKLSVVRADGDFAQRPRAVVLIEHREEKVFTLVGRGVDDLPGAERAGGCFRLPVRHAPREKSKRPGLRWRLRSVR